MNSKQKLRWSPAVPIRPKPNIISSDAVAHNQRAFRASYEDDTNIDMSALMSNEYCRKWFSEFEEHRSKNFQMNITKSTSMNKRRWIPRSKKKSEGKILPPIHLKQFENIPPRVNTYLPKRAPA